MKKVILSLVLAVSLIGIFLEHGVSSQPLNSYRSNQIAKITMSPDIDPIQVV